MKSIRLTSILLFALFLLASCSQELVETPIPPTGKEVMGHFSFKVAPLSSIGNNIQSKATDPTTVDESQVSNMWVVQYDKTTKAFLKKSYTEDVNIASYDAPLAANISGNCNIYFIANIGPVLPTLYTETEFLNYYIEVATEAAYLNNGRPINSVTKKNIPMSAVMENVNVPTSGTIENTTVELKRMLARVEVEYTIPADLSTYFALEGVRICNVPVGAQVMPPATNALTTTPVRTMPISNFTAEDITEGKHTLVYYLPENLKGVGSNTALTDARLKIGVEGATYLEFIGHTTGVQAGQEAGFCLYPGDNEFNDYNVVRNTKYKIQATFANISPSDQRVKIHDANCFMLRPGGSCNISVLRANKTDLGIQIPDVTSGWTVEVYWQTVQDMITVDNTTTMDKGYFKVTAAAGKEGNALVVAKVGAKVVWSWHIWVLNDDLNLPAYQAIVSGQPAWMDRNLGAIRKATTTEPYVNSGGLMYQWGRKDPFIGSVNAGTNPVPFDLFGKTGSAKFAPPTYTNLTTAAALTTNPVTNDPYIRQTTAVSWAENFRYSVAYPSLFIYNWYGSTSKDGTSTNDGRDSWGGEFNQPKALYDPCPEGWRVPSGKRANNTFATPFTGWVAADWGTNAAQDKNIGTISNGTPRITLPFMGLRGSGAAFQNAAFCYMHTATASSKENSNNIYFTYGTFSNPSAVGKYYGTIIRCVKEW